MSFEIDALIVFADRDNENQTAGTVGWVTEFKKFLELMLAQVMTKKPKVLLKSESDTMTSPTLDNVGVLITILSKDFVKSKQCKDHVDSFYRSLESSSSKINRVFKVIKYPVELQDQPVALRALIGYDMYHVDQASGEIKEFADYFNADAERQYWMEIIELSYDIQDALVSLSKGSVETKKIYKRKAVYLAETGHDLSVQRNIIHRELQRFGYSVLPTNALPINITELERVVRTDLEKCSMSIHLVGAGYGTIPEGTDRSVQDIQNKLAAENSVYAKERQLDFSRLIWLSPTLTHVTERQQRFIETLKRDVETQQEGAEIFQTLLEDFKNIVREELEDASEKRTLDDTEGRAIYFIHDKIDHTEAKPFINLIKQLGFSVLMPAFEGELLELRKKHIENLRNLDAAIIFRGKANEFWVRMKSLDLLKAPGFGRKKPILGKALVTPIGSITDRDSFKNQDLFVIEGDEHQSLESLKSFLQEFKR